MVRMEGATPRRRGCGEPLSEAQTRVKVVSGTGWNGRIGRMRKRGFRWGSRCCCQGWRGNRRSAKLIDPVFLSLFRNF